MYIAWILLNLMETLKMKTFHLYIISFFLCFTTVSFSQKPLQESHFAVGFFTGAHSQLITFAFVKTINGKVIGAEIIRKDRFIYTALGHWPHPANLKKENLFEKFNVDSCFLLKNENNKIIGYYATVFDNLWKIRFYEHPYKYDTRGWSQGQYKPSSYQGDYLRKEYGIDNILTDYLYGENLFKLLRNIQSPAWIINYKTVSKDTTNSP